MLLYTKETNHPVFHGKASLPQAGGKGKGEEKQKHNSSGRIKISLLFEMTRKVSRKGEKTEGKGRFFAGNTKNEV